MVRGIGLVFGAALLAAAGCAGPEEPLRTARVAGWAFRPDGGLAEVVMRSDDPDFCPGGEEAPRLVWMKVGNTIFLPQWYTRGPATRLQTGELPAAWRERRPGVWKIDYARVPLGELFPGLEVRVSE